MLGITILTEKADLLKEKVKETKDSITQETLKINAIEASNKKIEQSIETLASRQRAWQSKRKTDEEKLRTAIEELEKLDIDVELEAHERLTNWTELNNRITSLNKEKATVMRSLLESVQTNNLQNAFNKYLPAVLNSGTDKPATQKQVISESKVVSEVTGDKSAKKEVEIEERDNVIEIKRLAGLN